MRVVTLVVACALLPLPDAAFALANPASAFCATMGGHTLTATLADGGAIGLCSLPGKRIVEEWTLYRMFKGVKPAAGQNPFE